MLIDTVEVFIALLTGAMLGVFYFAGLWWTVRQLSSSQYVALLFMFSMLCRTSIVIIGFYFILGDNWQSLVTGLVGFIFVRLITTLYCRKKEASVKNKTVYEGNL